MSKHEMRKQANKHSSHSGWWGLVCSWWWETALSVCCVTGSSVCTVDLWIRGTGESRVPSWEARTILWFGLSVHYVRYGGQIPLQTSRCGLCKSIRSDKDHVIYSMHKACFQTNAFPPKVEKDLDLYPVTCQVIGIFKILMWISVLSLTSMG